jgi:hypothetical protein
LLVVEEHLDKLGNDGSIGSVGVLATTEDIEVAETIGVETIVACVLLGPLFITTLGEGIGGEKIAFDAFLFGKMGFVAIDTAAAGINELLDALLTGGFEHVEGTLDVVHAIEQGHLDATGYTAPSGLVEDVVDTFTCLHAGIEVLDVALDELITGIADEKIHIGLFACAEVVEATNAIAEAKDGLAQVGTDEAGSTCDEEKTIVWKF